MKRTQKYEQKLRKKFHGNITGPADLFGDRKPSFLFPIIAGLASHLMSNDPEKILSERSRKVRRFLHPIVMRLAPFFLEYKQVFESKNNLLGMDAPDEPLSLPKESVIWCGNHSFKDDIAATILAATRHAYILFGSMPMFFNSFDGITAYINGVTLCNRKVKASRTASVEASKRVMAMGTDILMFPEGVWNKTSHQPLLDFWPGVYRIARETNCMVVPVIHYLADPHKKYKGNVIHTVVADPISMEGLDEKEGLRLLRDTMASWYYLLMERYGQTTRKELVGSFATADEAWENYIAMHAGAVPYYDKEIELAGDFRPRPKLHPEDVWKSVAEISRITSNNAAEVAYATQLVAQEQRRDFQRRF